MPTKRRNKAQETRKLTLPKEPQILAGEEYPRIGGKTLYERKYYTTGRVYIVDDNGGRGTTVTWGITVADAHASKVAMVKSCFKMSSPYSVVSVPPFDTTREWTDWWENEATTWAKRELITIYYHGNAGQNDRRYSWFLAHGGFNVNAFDFITMLIETGHDVLLILECYVPTRFKNKSILQKALEEHGNTVEIYATGPPGQADDNTPIPNDFTERLLREFHQLIFGKNSLRNCSLKCWSVNELLRSDRDIHNNPKKMELAPVTPGAELRKIIDKKTKKGEPKETIKNRIGVDKHYVRRRQKLSFCRDTIEDTKKQRLVDNIKSRLADNLPVNPGVLQPDFKEVFGGEEADWLDPDEGYVDGEAEADKNGGEENEADDEDDDDEVEGGDDEGLFC